MVAAGGAATGTGQGPGTTGDDGAWSQGIRAGEPLQYVLLDSTLQQRRIRIVKLGDDSLVWSDDAGKQQTVSFSSISALLPTWWMTDRAAEPTSTDVPTPAPRQDIPNKTYGGVLELVDGQRLPGRVSPDRTTSEDSIVWENPSCGAVVVKLDLVSRIDLWGFVQPTNALLRPRNPGAVGTAPAAPAKPAASAMASASTGMRAPRTSGTGPAAGVRTRDRVYLANGDKLEGFVTRINQMVSIEVDGKSIDNEVRQVASVELANADKPATGMRVWLADGAVLSLQSVRIEDRASAAPIVRLELAKSTWETASAPATSEPPSADPSKRPAKTVRVEHPKDGPGPMIALSKAQQVVAIAPEVSRIAAMSELDLASATTTGDRVRPPLAPVGIVENGSYLDESGIDPFHAEQIVLSGPLTTQWKLPAGAVRVAGRAELPRESWAWGNCELVIGVVTAPGGTGKEGFRELVRTTLNGDKPSTSFNLVLGDGSAAASGAELRIAVEQGATGPVQDRVMLSRGLVLRQAKGTGKP